MVPLFPPPDFFGDPAWDLVLAAVAACGVDDPHPMIVSIVLLLIFVMELPDEMNRGVVVENREGGM